MKSPECIRGLLSAARGIRESFSRRAGVFVHASRTPGALVFHRIRSWVWILGMFLGSHVESGLRVVAQDFAPDRLLVLPRPGRDRSELDGLQSRNRFRTVRRHEGLGGLQVVRLPAGMKVSEALRLHRESGLVAYAEPDYILRRSAIPDDPAVKNGTQWHLNNLGVSGGRAGVDIDAVEGWNTVNSASNIVVAVVDSGIRYTHEDLAANMWRNPGEIPDNGIDDDRNGIVDDVHGIDAITNSGDPMDVSGHGTHTSGIIGAVGGNGTGGSGVAWTVQLMACKFMEASGEGLTSDAVQCLDYARIKGAKVVNCSWGGAGTSVSLGNAIARLRDAGAVVVVAAGNDAANNDTSPQYPGNYPNDNIFVVGATTSSDSFAGYSNFGATTVDIAAPGSAVYSTWSGSDRSYSTQSGTSMAAPVVSGVVALVMSRFPSETPAQIIERVMAAADPLTVLAGKCVSGGRVNLNRALQDNIFADFSASLYQGTPPLAIQFTNSTRGEITQQTWDFGDGESSTEKSPSHVFRREGNFKVTLQVTDAQGRKSSKTREILAVGNYDIREGTFDWVDDPSMETLRLTDNGVSAARPIPFPFKFYAQDYNTLYVSANGMIGFRPDGLGLQSNTTVPTTTTPNAMIAAYWDDLNPSTTGVIRAGTVGEAPGRRYVVSWEGVPLTRGGALMSFQALLEEGTGRIVLQYLEVQPLNTRGGGRSATVGIENEGGTIGVRHLLNGAPTTLSNNQALVFQPRFSEGLRVSSVTGFHPTGPVGGGFSPSSLTVTLENSGGDVLTWNAERAVDWLDLTPEFGVLAPGEKSSLVIAVNRQASKLAAGRHMAEVSLLNLSSGIGNVKIPVSLTVNGTDAVFTLAEDSDLSISGFEGGPFLPASRLMTFSNTGDASLRWSVVADGGWFEVTPGGGELAAGESGFATLRVAATALELKPGNYVGTVRFVNETSGRGGGERQVNLRVLSTSAPTLLLRGGFESLSIDVMGPAGRVCVVESSPNLTDWVELLSGTISSEGVFKTGPIVPAATQLFYRARIPQ